MKSFKKFLLERSFESFSDSEVNDADFYGEHKNTSPEEFGKFIQSLTGQMGEKEKKIKAAPQIDTYDIHPSFYAKQDNQRQLDYHMSNPNLTDEHFHHAVPHLLNYDYESTMENKDIPWHILKPHAELAMAASPNRKFINVFNRREAHEQGKQ
jgi:hypothetical protein